jgi:Zn finger protein HypA/HybF involved in hydrogenase expression
MTSITVDQLRALIRQEAGGSSASRAPAKLGHETIKEMLECPGCFSEVIKELDASEYQCPSCHLPMYTEKLSRSLEACPRCGETHREKVER